MYKFFIFLQRKHFILFFIIFVFTSKSYADDTYCADNGRWMNESKNSELLANCDFDDLKIKPTQIDHTVATDLDFIINGQEVTPIKIGSTIVTEPYHSDNTTHLSNRNMQIYCINTYADVNGNAPYPILIGTYALYRAGNAWKALNFYTLKECKNSVSIDNHAIKIKYDVVDQKRKGRVDQFERVIDSKGNFKDTKISSYFNKLIKKYNDIFTNH